MFSSVCTFCSRERLWQGTKTGQCAVIWLWSPSTKWDIYNGIPTPRLMKMAAEKQKEPGEWEDCCEIPSLSSTPPLQSFQHSSTSSYGVTGSQGCWGRVRFLPEVTGLVSHVQELSLTLKDIWVPYVLSNTHNRITGHEFDLSGGCQGKRRCWRG